MSRMRQLISLAHRRIRGDLICMYKIMHGHVEYHSDTVFAEPSALGFAVIPSKFTNSYVKPISANIRSLFKRSHTERIVNAS